MSGIEVSLSTFSICAAKRRRYAEVQQLYDPSLGNENVTRLDIGMHDAFGVCITESGAKLFDDRRRSCPLQTRRMFANKLLERLTAQPFHRQIVGVYYFIATKV